MIALLLSLIMAWQGEAIYTGYLSLGNPHVVAISKGWQGVDQFDVLLAMPDCGLVSRWVWVITDKGVESGLVTDCSLEWDYSLGLVADTDRADLVHEYVFIVLR